MAIVDALAPPRAVELTERVPIDHIDTLRLALRQALAPGHRRAILLPYALGQIIEPTIAPRTEPPVLVIQTLGEPITTQSNHESTSGWQTGALQSAWSQAGYTGAVRSVLGLIRAGDAYQVNLSHRLTAPFRGDALAMAESLFAQSEPAFGGFMCFDHHDRRHAVLSLSPELFLSYDPATRQISTKPMKGTRPIASDPAELRDHPKDRAELNMIVDLMRNDLGRVSTPGSVRVTRPRDIDAHADSVWQATATVTGELAPAHGPEDLMVSAFPPGSVTGAPKVRSAQIINTLEPEPRGPYCGSMVRVEPSGAFTASVLIRTAHITGTPDPATPHGLLDARLCYHAGAGIVADSDPDAEWRETLVKADALKRALERNACASGDGSR